MKGAFVTDEHFPYQDEKARQVALKVVEEFDPDAVVCGSDGIDFYQLSHFDKNPERVKLGLQDEIDLWKKGMVEWKSAAPKAKFHFLKGNHEDRLRKYLWRNPELFDLDVLKLETILELSKYGIKNTNFEEIIFLDRLVVKHGDCIRKGAGASSRAELERERYSISVLTGHSHRGGSVLVSTREGFVQGQEGLCLCKLDPEYVQHPDWQHGIVLFNVTKDAVNFEPVPIRSFRDRKLAIWRGKEFSS
jgi:hypothetical protein